MFSVLQLRADLWGPEDEWTPAMVRSCPRAAMRVLLQGPDCRVWYLGERVRGWQSGGRSKRVHVAPPRGMFHGHLLWGDALDAARRGVDADELLDRSKRRYQEFVWAHLLQRVGPDASTS